MLSLLNQFGVRTIIIVFIVVKFSVPRLLISSDWFTTNAYRPVCIRVWKKENNLLPNIWLKSVELLTFSNSYCWILEFCPQKLLINLCIRPVAADFLQTAFLYVSNILVWHICTCWRMKWQGDFWFSVQELDFVWYADSYINLPISTHTTHTYWEVDRLIYISAYWARAPMKGTEKQILHVLIPTWYFPSGSKTIDVLSKLPL